MSNFPLLFPYPSPSPSPSLHLSPFVWQQKKSFKEASAPNDLPRIAYCKINCLFIPLDASGNGNRTYTGK